MIHRVANRDVHDENPWVAEREDSDWSSLIKAKSATNMGAPWDWSTLHGQNSPTSSSSTSSPSPTRSSTTTSKDDFAHTPSLTPSTAIPQSHGNGGAWPSSTGSADPANVSNLSKSPESDNDSNSMPLPHIVVAALLPVVFLTILGVILFFYLRRRRRQKAHTQVREMKTQTSGNYPRPAYAVPPVLPPPAGSPIAPQPVILGPIVPGSNGAYYTGIDTSDIISMHDTTGTGNPFVDQSDPHDEPPPPYRPRSIAATISRNTSLRQAQPAALSETNLMAAQGQGPRSPFADPHDDAISEFSEPTRRRFGRRNEDELSAVSDISYQQEPVIVRPTV